MTQRSIGLALAALLGIAACAPGATRTTFPPLGVTPQPAGDATAATKQQVIAALAAKGLQAADAIRAYRPPEGPLLAAAPRSVVQVELTNDPDPGYIVIYALGSEVGALAAAEDHMTYLARGEGGGSLLPPGTSLVVRVVGSNVLFFHWLPANSPDPRTPDVAAALGTLGVGVPESP